METWKKKILIVFPLLVALTPFCMLEATTVRERDQFAGNGADQICSLRGKAENKQLLCFGFRQCDAPYVKSRPVCMKVSVSEHQTGQM